MNETNKKLSEGSALAVVDVRITDVGQIPANYFMHDAVIEALRQVVRSDVVVYGKSVPPGAQGIYAPAKSLLASHNRLAVATQDFKRSLKVAGPTFVVIYAAIVAIILIFLLVKVTV